MTVRSLFFICGLAFGLQAFAQAYPAGPVKVVVGVSKSPEPPGGNRLIADEMSKSLGVAVAAAGIMMTRSRTTVTLDEARNLGRVRPGLSLDGGGGLPDRREGDRRRGPTRGSSNALIRSRTRRA